LTFLWFHLISFNAFFSSKHRLKPASELNMFFVKFSCSFFRYAFCGLEYDYVRHAVIPFEWNLHLQKKVHFEEKYFEGLSRFGRNYVVIGAGLQHDSLRLESQSVVPRLFVVVGRSTLQLWDCLVQPKIYAITVLNCMPFKCLKPYLEKKRVIVSTFLIFM